MIYLASPYSHADKLIRKTRFMLAEQCVAKMLEARHWVYSPIVHCHALAEKFSLPGDFNFWQEYDFAMLRIAASMAILKIPGWDLSGGVTAEREFAKLAGIPVSFVNENGEFLGE